MGRQANLRVQVLGVLAVAVDGRAVPPQELASRKGRTLLKLLLARRGEVVPADVLVEALWAGRPPVDPDANLATLVSRLRAVLGPDVIAGDRHGWRFVAGPRVEIDLEEATRLAGEAGARLPAEPALALAAAERALALLGRGPFLADEPDADWALPARREAERLAARARRLAWDAALAVGDHARALAHADAATTVDPLDEAAWRAVMAAHTAAGEPAAALAAYERLRQTLAEELGTDPAPESQALHLAILRLRGAEPGPGSLSAEPGTRSVQGEAEAGSLQAELGASVPGHRARRPDGARTPGPPSQVGGWGPRTPPAGQSSAGGPRTTSAPGLASPAAAPADAGFVGREGELADLARAWEGAVGGQPRLVLVAGEAGIGKTRLVEAAAELASATGGLVVQARCYEAERSLFLQPVAEAVRAAALALPPDRLAAAAGEAAGTLAELVPELRRLLDLPGYERAPAELERRRSFEAVTAFLRGLAAQQPLLLTLDDFHQAGAATLELLHFVARRLAGDRVLVVATVRAEEGAESLAALADVGRVLELGPLPAAAVAELARRFGVADLAGPVLERARGHTLFTVESLRAAAEGGRDPAAVPASLREAVQTRARRSGPEVEALLRAATVVGAAFDLEVVAGLLELPVDVTARRAEQAMAARLLVEDEAGAGYRFANDLVREVLYRTSPRPTRVTRHRRLAAMLANRPEAAAGHAAAAGDWATAARAWMAAAAEAARSYANRDAERLLDQAVAAATEAGDPALEAAARLDRGRALVALGDYPAAFADQEQALRLATAHGLDRLEAAALEQLGWTAYYSRDHQAASELTPQARELAERAVAAPRAAPTALLLAARMRHAEGDLVGAREAFDAVLGEPDPATQTTGLTYLGLLLEHADQFAEARRVLDRSIEACRAAGLVRPLLTSCFAATLACANLGDLSGALDRLALLERLLADVEDRFYHARAATTGSWLWRELGDPGRALVLADRATELLGPATTGTHPGLHAQLALAECALLAGDDGQAAALLETAGGQLERPFGYRWRVELRHAELTSRLDPPAAEGLLELARTYGSTKYQALALARLGRRPQALALVAASGSDYLIAQVAPPAQARAAIDRIAAALPAELRPAFLRHGHLAAATR
jgi:DNA-binding SARP family transcriptional activator